MFVPTVVIDPGAREYYYASPVVATGLIQHLSQDLWGREHPPLYMLCKKRNELILPITGYQYIPYYTCSIMNTLLQTFLY